MGVRIINVNAADQVFSNAGGGGGSSDFTTATVTVSVPNNFTQNGALALGNIVDDDETYGSAIFGDIVVSGNYQAVLYKGKCYCAIYAFSAIPPTIEISGDITEFEGMVYLITGDCTITISYDV